MSKYSVITVMTSLQWSSLFVTACVASQQQLNRIMLLNLWCHGRS